VIDQLGAETEQRINAILEEYAEPNAKPRWATKQRDRMLAIATWCAQNEVGDLAEIGAYRGETTKRLLQVAEAYDRRVLVVDPWKTGTQNCNGTEYPQFVLATQPWADRLDVVRLPSQNKEAIIALMLRDLCFAYVDGLHKYGPALGDIMAVRHVRGVIAVDDTRQIPEVRQAFFQAAVLLGKRTVFRPELGIREGYLV